MTTLVATNGIPVKGIDLDRFSIVTIFGAATQRPAWQTMFGWPADGTQAVPLDVRSAADRTRWAARLDDAVRGADRAVLLVADGLGCAASAWWARLSPADYVARIAGAILALPITPVDDEMAPPVLHRRTDRRVARLDDQRWKGQAGLRRIEQSVPIAATRRQQDRPGDPRDIVGR